MRPFLRPHVQTTCVFPHYTLFPYMPLSHLPTACLFCWLPCACGRWQHVSPDNSSCNTLPNRIVFDWRPCHCPTMTSNLQKLLIDTAEECSFLDGKGEEVIDGMRYLLGGFDRFLGRAASAMAADSAERHMLAKMFVHHAELVLQNGEEWTVERAKNNADLVIQYALHLHSDPDDVVQRPTGYLKQQYSDRFTFTHHCSGKYPR
jgi:hypothetical protein